MKVSNCVKKSFAFVIGFLLMLPSEGCSAKQKTNTKVNAPIYRQELPKIHCEKCEKCDKELSKCQVAHKTHGKHLVGKASWYGGRFHGRRTASGERFNKHALTAAHKTLPLGSKVIVTNLKNNSSVVVEINDRGPFVRGRIIDLSQAAAQAIGMYGTEQVRITRLN